MKPKYKNVQPNSKSLNSNILRRNGQNDTLNTSSEGEINDLTRHITKRKINQSTLLLYLKGVKITDLKPNITVRSFPGARIVTIGEIISKHVIVSLLNTSDAENRLIIAWGLLPRASVDFKPYNEMLRDICNENDLVFIDNYDNFLLACDKMPETYFHRDKLHINASGTRRLLKI